MTSTIEIIVSDARVVPSIVRDIKEHSMTSDEPYNFVVRWRNEEGDQEVWISDEGDEVWVGRGSEEPCE